jgi:DNA-binding response OmpR family regulator
MYKGKKRIVVIDDDRQLVQLVRETLEAEGYQVAVFFDGLPFLRYVRDKGLPHLALIDLHLPSMHGFDLSRKLKALGDVPIVFISNENEVETVIDGLKRFADDYVTKPFDIRELVIRVQRILSRIPNAEYIQSRVTQIDERLGVDFGNSCLLINSRPVTLTPIEANLLYILIQNAGRVVPSDNLIARVWPAEEVYEETLRVHIHRLRRKLESDYRQPRYIQTERGVGYWFAIEKTLMADENGGSS